MVSSMKAQPLVEICSQTVVRYFVLLLSTNEGSHEIKQFGRDLRSTLVKWLYSG